MRHNTDDVSILYIVLKSLALPDQDSSEVVELYIFATMDENRITKKDCLT